MTKNYTVSTKINRPVKDVFDAIVSGELMIKYFTDSVSGDLVVGETIEWTWDEYGSNLIKVEKVVPSELIELSLDSKNWSKTKDDNYTVTVSFEFEALDDRTTRLSISESGWRDDAEGYAGSHDNCGGWQHMLCCLKAYLEYGVDLRR